jgi:5-methylcytosine-specific restriction endonuclease McrA
MNPFVYCTSCYVFMIKSMSNSAEYMRTYMLKRYRARMADAIIRLGGKCIKCSSTRDLQLDHVDPSTKLFGLGNKWSVSKARFEAELIKCQILCQTCHTAKTIVDLGQSPTKGLHGTKSSYRHYCRCDVCREANNAYQRDLRRKKKLNQVKPE